MSRITKHKISNDNSHVYILGISCDYTDYKLCWKLNSELRLQLSMGKEICPGTYPRLHENLPVFTTYYFEDSESDKFYKLLVNRHENEILLPKLKNIDFFFYLSGFSEDDFLLINSKIRNIKGVSAVITIETTTLNKKQRDVLLT